MSRPTLSADLAGKCSAADTVGPSGTPSQSRGETFGGASTRSRVRRSVRAGRRHRCRCCRPPLPGPVVRGIWRDLSAPRCERPGPGRTSRWPALGAFVLRPPSGHDHAWCRPIAARGLHAPTIDVVALHPLSLNPDQMSRALCRTYFLQIRDERPEGRIGPSAPGSRKPGRCEQARNVSDADPRSASAIERPPHPHAPANHTQPVSLQFSGRGQVRPDQSQRPPHPRTHRR